MKKSLFLVAFIGSLALAGCQTMGGGNGSTTSEFNCIAGTIGGAVVGGLVGSTIGGGTGNTLATAAGIGLGGYGGNRLGCN